MYVSCIVLCRLFFFFSVACNKVNNISRPLLACSVWIDSIYWGLWVVEVEVNCCKFDQIGNLITRCSEYSIVELYRARSFKSLNYIYHRIYNYLHTYVLKCIKFMKRNFPHIKDASQRTDFLNIFQLNSVTETRNNHKTDYGAFYMSRGKLSAPLLGYWNC